MMQIGFIIVAVILFLIDFFWGMFNAFRTPSTPSKVFFFTPLGLAFWAVSQLI